MPVEIGGMILLSLKEITDEFDITEYALRRYIRIGRISGKKFGRNWYVPEKALKDFFNKPGRK